MFTVATLMFRWKSSFQVEVELLLTSCLAMGESGVLFGISDHKSNLVAQSVVPNDLLGMLPSVS